MKLIDFNEVSKSAKKTRMTDCYTWVDDALRKKEKFIMPPKIHIAQKENAYFNVMPTIYNDIAMIKTIGRHPVQSSDSRPSMMGDMMLYDASTGVLKAVMDAEYITTLRTGVVAAHSALLFAKKTFKTIGLLGLGNIMSVCFKTILDKLKSDRDTRKLLIKLYKHKGQEEIFVKKFKDYTNIEFIFCDSYEETINESDIVISAVTSIDGNFVEDSYYKRGVTVIPICTMGFQNCDLFFDKVFTDDIDQIRGFKYFSKFKSLSSVTDVLLKKKEGRTNDDERILIYDYGLAIHDLYFGMKFYNMNIGREVEYNFPNNKHFI